MNTRINLRTTCITIFLIIVGFLLPSQVKAEPLLQLTPFPTPTPGSDGRIIYIVQPGDTLLRISLISGVTVDEIRGLNNLTGDNIQEGQKLLLGLGGPSQVTPTPGPSPTPTLVIPTATSQPGKGVLCVILFQDINGDAIRQEVEPSIPGGAISISNQAGTVSITSDTTDGLEHTCYQDLPEGKYTISVAIPEGYNPTTVGSFVLELNAGDETYLNFGAQKNSETLSETPLPTGEGKSPLLGIIGGILLFAGIGLALFARRIMKGG
jgi:hypothetical protein